MLYFFSRILPPHLFLSPHLWARTNRYAAAMCSVVGALGGASLLFVPPAIAQETETPAEPAAPAAPTARYANGEDVDLSEIIAEWRGYYADVPVYLCVCQDGTCDQTDQWPYREYDRYQFGVALGPASGQVAEAAGSNCFDIADGSRPSSPRAFSAAQVDPSAPAADPPAAPDPDDSPSVSPEPSASEPPAPEPAAESAAESPSPEQSEPPAAANPEDIPVATAINDGSAIQLNWPSGTTSTVDINDGDQSWDINILNALDCESLSVVEAKMMSAQRIVGTPVVDPMTGNVAVPVLLDSCVEVDQMAVFILDPAEGGGYALYRTQLPAVRGSLQSANRGFPDEFSSYAYNTVLGIRYWDRTLLVRQGSAAGTEVISLFRPGQTPAGLYAGCGIVREGEGASVLCDQ